MNLFEKFFLSPFASFLESSIAYCRVLSSDLSATSRIVLKLCEALEAPATIVLLLQS